MESKSWVDISDAGTEAGASHVAADEQYAKDMQLAMNLQAKEDHDEIKRKQAGKKKHRGRHAELDGFCTNSKMKGVSDHMLFVLCEVDHRVVEMLVDSGASTSAVSSTMVEKLGLRHKLSPHVAGQAKGVGSANILGALENIACTIGHVEFRLFFMVIESPVPFLILGLDQMRRFNCVLDLSSNLLRFGGADGVSVPFLDQEMASEAAEKSFMAKQSQQQHHQPTASSRHRTKNSASRTPYVIHAQPPAQQPSSQNETMAEKLGFSSMFGAKKKSSSKPKR
mmetsp:Transcript_8226/g.23662  ORF Transcript_8226/g.23662 Transcript_8226/m.23662 type:complete len:281 (-) Transcript_8226:226-1068(-)